MITYLFKKLCVIKLGATKSEATNTSDFWISFMVFWKIWRTTQEILVITIFRSIPSNQEIWSIMERSHIYPVIFESKIDNMYVLIIQSHQKPGG